MNITIRQNKFLTVTQKNEIQLFVLGVINYCNLIYLSHLIMAYSLQTAIVRILPKANEIDDTAQQDFRSIYPFKLKKMNHVQDVINKKSPDMFQYNKNSYVNTFKPSLKTVKQHFHSKYLIYDKFNNNFDEEIFNANIYSIQKLKNLKNNDFIINRQETQEFSLKNEEFQLVFDSRFECGNLSFVSKIEDQFYLLLHNDVNTSGYTNWFYFSVEPKKLGRQKFAILNYGKAGWAFSNGPGICCRVENQWKRGGQNIFCQSNSKIFDQKDPYKKFNTLSFQFEFTSLQKVYFSYNLPYSYTDLLTTLDQVERQNYKYFHKKLAGTTICGNRIEMLTIGNFEKHKQSTNLQDIPVIVLFARAHAGETVSSWVLHFFLMFILSNQIEARILRDKYLFKIFPMLNPDGVIHGNYRCSLIGRDLNRRWNKAIKQMYPEVYYVKNQILELSQKKVIKLVVDLHGHTQKKQAFFFGCNDKSQPHKCRLLPYLLSKISQSFDFGSANFCMDKSKISTARVTLFMLLKNCDVFTLETSQFGMNNEVLYRYLYQEIGQSLAKGIYFYFKLNKFAYIYQRNDKNNELTQTQRSMSSRAQKSDKYQEQSLQNITQPLVQYLPEQEIDRNVIDTDKLQKQIIQNTALLKTGIQKDDGSDSQPSVCNINFENLNRMCHRKDMKINSFAIKEIERHKKNASRVLVNNKILSLNKKSIDLLPMASNNKLLPAPKRFASTSHSYRKNSEDSSEYHNLTKTLNKFRTNKSSTERGISAPSINSRNTKKSNPQQIVKMINFEMSFDGFNSHRSETKRKYRATNNDILNKIMDARLNNFANYTQPSLTRPYSYLYRNKK